MKVTSFVTAAAAFSTAQAYATTSSCKCFPGDACWPSDSQWKSLNTTVNGRLIKTVPLGSPCHDPTYDAVQCKYLQDQWQHPGIHMNSSSSVMAPWFANQSCDPFQPESRACELGNYVRYAVEAQTKADVVNTINFARNNNIRFVIRNTGHDYNGRSTGAGALSVWTHRLKDIQFKDYNANGYKGKAVTLGAGVQGFDILKAGNDAGYVVIGGECPTVGVTGGYTQGGGHSALSTSFGLSAQNTLEFEVVTADSGVVTASPTKNSDLFWALNGGGGGNWGVVLSMTVKAFPDAKVGAATLAFFNTNNDQATFYKAIETFHSKLPGMVDAGSMVVYYFTNTFFQIAPLTAFGKSQDEVQTLLAPFVSSLDTLGVNYTVKYSQSANYYNHYDTYFGPLPIGNIQVGIAQYGGRLIPRDTIVNNNDDLTQAAISIVEQGVTWIGVGTNVAPFSNPQKQSLLPAWNNALVHATLTTPWNFTAPWSDMLDLQNLMTDTIMPEIEAVTPGSGAYMNEADFRQPNFQSEFFGANYNKLLSVKAKWDKQGFFYARNAVGSEQWTVSDNGRMYIRCICLRLITAYGPRQRPDLAIHKFTRLIHQGKPIPLFGDGSSRCDYTYVDDIIDGIFAALKYDGSDYYGVFNLGESQTIQLMLSDQEPIKMNSEIRGISPGRVKDVPDDLKSVSSPLVEHGKTVDWSDMPLYTDFFLSTVPAMLHHNKYKERRATWWDRLWYYQELRGLVKYALLPREADEPLATVQLEDSRVKYWAASAEEMDRYPRMGKLNANLTAYDRFPKMEPSETCRYGSRKPRESKATWEEEVFRDCGGEFNGS
ncbi:hypothetical protein BFJ66_g11340 [Fusarium oxysporum f. sp. cepae]|uniref:FAD-binding PCMH-type domain-containing protein n=1 Tax=Fusarium oxysporum f. sp. cepae TaxID=396571 RepID=A0A3L6P3G4_FUSOX|nr:hypothetical protein BFJ65_g3893 [Fusarium oxysporum f. sp. cepae]RKK38861.1 hypothetical protein BFJ67_g11702 [Fusarium oxysporum f. sp. cepae]RKK40737.1 hypothetical protein BFJ66_g11340 [Fusarium oxysporum f. sp. cepae]